MRQFLGIWKCKLCLQSRRSQHSGFEQKLKIYIPVLTTNMRHAENYRLDRAMNAAAVGALRRAGTKRNVCGFLGIGLAACLMSCSQSRLPAPVSNAWFVSTEPDWGHLPKYYVVKKGETLFSISLRSSRKYQELALLNNIEPPYRLYEGQVIKLEE